MKIIKYIFFVLLIVFVSYHSFAQDDVYYTPNNKQKKEKEEKDFNPQKRKINSGYVFIDGKYVESPYTVKRKKCGIYINNIKITKCHLISDKRTIIKIRKDPGSPKNIAKMDSINVIFRDTILEYNINYVLANYYYYYGKHSDDKAMRLMKEFFQGLPNIKSVEGEETLHVTAWNGDIKMLSVRPPVPIYNKLQKKRHLRYNHNLQVDMFKERFIKGGVSFIFPDDKTLDGYAQISFGATIAMDRLKKIYEILVVDTISNETKVKQLKENVFFGNSIDKYLDVFIENMDTLVLKEILENNYTLTYTECDNFDKIGFISDTCMRLKDPESEIAFSPKSNFVNIGCPDPWGSVFLGLNPSFETVSQKFYELVEHQGYNDVCYNIDLTNNDVQTGSLTYENFKNFCAGGVNLWMSHGVKYTTNMEGYIQVAYFNSTENDIDLVLQDWFGGNDMSGFGVIEAINPNENNWGGDTPPFILVAYPEVASNLWKPKVNTYNSITMISSCYSYQNGFVQACGTNGATLGYNDVVMGVAAHSNNKALLKRLNGTINTSGNYYRNTGSAYNNYSFSNLKMYPPNTNITLCPATKEYYPEKNAIVSSEVSTGFFETDTWCDATQPAWKALKLEFSNGDLSYNPVNDVYWDNPVDGRSNKIIYEWSGTEGNVKVKVFPQYIIAYGGGGQQLDFDKVCPNGEEGAYSFRVVDAEIEGFTCNFSASPSTSVCSGNTVRFIPYCTNEITSYSWHFEGGNPELTTESNPEIHYGESGLYDVTLHAWNSENEVFSITKNDYIYVYDNDIAYDNPTVSCDYFLYGDAAIKYMVYVDYVPEGYSYNITVYYGDGTTSSTNTVENPTILESIRHYSSYGTYYPFVEVKLTGHDEPLFITDCGNVDVVNLNPCSNFTADFNFYPEDPQPNEEIFFEPIINNCGENCYWSWDFASEPSSPVYNDDPVWCCLNTNVDVTHTYNTEGNYYVKLTVYESENGCPPFVVEKEVPVGYHVSCFDPINIYCSHYKPGTPIDRVLVRKYPCALELYWHHTINTYDQCQPINHPDFAEMSLYKLGTPSLEINTNLIRTSPYSSSDPPWIWPHDYCYYSLLTWDYLPYGRYIFKVDVSGYAGYDYQTAVGKIDVDIVDCDLIATFNGNSSENDAKFADAVNNPPYYSSGKFILNSSVNEFVNSNSGIYNACNGIILCDGFKTGNKSFIATGYGFADCIIDPIYWWGYNVRTFPDIIDESQNSIILTFDASPNPYRDFVNVHIELSKSSEAILTLFNYNGAFIEMLAKTDLTVGLNEFEFDLGSLSPGTYMLKALINDSEEKTLKIIKH